jgi:hypothetical protein
MRKILKMLLVPAAFAMVAGAGIATTAAPAKADLILNPVFPFLHVRPDYSTVPPPPTYYYAPRCYWDAYGGRVCY